MIERNLLLVRLSSLAVLLAACGGSPPVEPGDGGMTITDSGPPACGPGTERCGDVCVDTDHSRAHCGSCGNECEAGEACVEGACDVVCPASQVECGGSCVDTDSDRQHCGECDAACESGEACVDGACATSCPAGQELCTDACIDTTSHPEHCGACDETCEAGEVCSDGECQASCGGGLTDCDGACVSADHDPMNCGGCGTVCPTVDGAVGVCESGDCVVACEPLAGDCNADLGSGTTDGCETPVATDVTNCGACGRACSAANGVAGCDAGSCVVAACDTGFSDCNEDAADGCEIQTATDAENCGTCGMVCATGTECVAGTCAAPMGESCGDAVALTLGTNTVAWSATASNYFSEISCFTNGWDLVGPDVVLSFTATEAGRYTLVFSNKPGETRWGATVSTGACGTLTPEIACISEWGPMVGSFALEAGQTAYIYVRDTESGASPLSNPLVLDVVRTDCASTPPIRLDPPNGSTADRRAATFTIDFEAPIITTAGTITLTGNMGSSVSYDLATAPPEVTFVTSSAVMTIEPQLVFQPGEVVTVSWSGIQGVVCTTPVTIPAPTWQVTIPTPPCGGTTSATVTRVPTDLATYTAEFYIAADPSPTGYVYLGGTASLYRIPKAGGPSENVYTIAGLTADQLGYALLFHGPNIFTVESRIGGAIQHVWRISSDGGATWNVEDYARFPVGLSDDLRAAVVYDGRIYAMTQPSTPGVATEIWSIDAAATTLPAVARLERSFLGEEDCSGLARDASFYYAACALNERIVRVPVAGGAPELVTTFFDLSTSIDALRGVDSDADGTFDVLYVQTQNEEAGYVCAPTSGSAYVDYFVRFGVGNGSFGMDLDRGSSTFWLYDDDDHQLVSVQ